MSSSKTSAPMKRLQKASLSSASPDEELVTKPTSLTQATKTPAITSTNIKTSKKSAKEAPVSLMTEEAGGEDNSSSYSSMSKVASKESLLMKGPVGKKMATKSSTSGASAPVPMKEAPPPPLTKNDIAGKTGKMATKSKKKMKTSASLALKDLDEDEEEEEISVKDGRSSELRSSRISSQQIQQLNDLPLKESEKKKPPSAVEKFVVLRDHKIGAGGFGVVYMGFDNKKGCQVAVKETKVSLQNQGAVEALKSEFELLKGLDHPNIVRVFEFEFNEAENTCRIFMEMVNSGSVISVMQKMKFRLYESIIKKYLASALDGLSFLHESGVVHRDVKPANMLVSALGTLKLSDFGTSKAQQNQSATTTANVVGTCAYLSQEAIRGKFSPASDLWALGCSVVEMATGQMPWAHLPSEEINPISLMFHIGTAQPPNHHPPLPSHLSTELKEILTIMFAADPKDRSTAKELRARPYFDGEDLPASSEPLTAYNAAKKEAQPKLEGQRTFSRDSTGGLTDATKYSGTDDGVSRTFGQTGTLATMDLQF